MGSAITLGFNVNIKLQHYNEAIYTRTVTALNGKTAERDLPSNAYFDRELVGPTIGLRSGRFRIEYGIMGDLYHGKIAKLEYDYRDPSLPAPSQAESEIAYLREEVGPHHMFAVSYMPFELSERSDAPQLFIKWNIKYGKFSFIQGTNAYTNDMNEFTVFSKNVIYNNIGISFFLRSKNNIGFVVAAYVGFSNIPGIIKQPMLNFDVGVAGDLFKFSE